MGKESEFNANNQLSNGFGMSNPEVDLEKISNYLTVFDRYIERKGWFFKTETLNEKKIDELKTFFINLSNMFEGELVNHKHYAGKEDDAIGTQLTLAITSCRQSVSLLSSQKDLNQTTTVIKNLYVKIYNNVEQIKKIKKDIEWTKVAKNGTNRF